MQKISTQVLDILEQNVIFAIDVVQNEKRQYINKHVQNSLNNYFLENYCVLDLKKKFEIHSGRQIKNIIQDKYQHTTQFNNLHLNFASEQQVALKKYYVLMLGFLEEHINNGTLDKYREAMLRIIQEELAPTTSSATDISSTADSAPQWISPYTLYNNDKDKICKWVQLQWKRLLALFVLHHSYYPQIEAIYQIWFDIFQSRIVDATTQKKKKPENNRPYKYFELPYLNNNEFYSSQPLVVQCTEENTQKTTSRKQKQQIPRTSESLLTEEGTEGTAAESIKQQKGKRKCNVSSNNTKVSQKITNLEDSSAGDHISSKNNKRQVKTSIIQETGNAVQSNSDNQVIEKMPYKKVKRQADQNAYTFASGTKNINGASSVIKSEEKLTLKGTSFASQKKQQDVEDENYRNSSYVKGNKQSEKQEEDKLIIQSALAGSRKEQISSLSKNYIPQQANSAFSKYKQKTQLKISDQSKSIQDQVNQATNFNSFSDSNKSKSDISSPKAVISIIPACKPASYMPFLSQESSKKEHEKTEDPESSNPQQDKQNDQSTCNQSQNMLQSPVSQTLQGRINNIPINSFSFQLTNPLNTQPAIQIQQQPLQLMYQPYITHQQINQFIHPNQMAAAQQVIPIINMNNMSFLQIPINYISMMQPNCAPATQATYMNINQY